MKTQITFLTIILLCLALDPCTAHDLNDAPNTETTAQDSELPFSFPPSQPPNNDNPTTTTTTSEEDSESSQPYTSFSAAFSDILKGTLRGNSLTMPESFQEFKEKYSNSDNSVQNICSHTDYPDVCLTTVAPFLGHHRHFDLMNVLAAAIKACSFQTNFTMAKVARHMASSPEIAAALAECKEQYADALENLQRAMEAIPSRDLGTVTVMLSAVMADVSTCESGFEDLKSTSPMTNSEGLVTITASNCLAIASLIPY